MEQNQEDLKLIYELQAKDELTLEDQKIIAIKQKKISKNKINISESDDGDGDAYKLEYIDDLIDSLQKQLASKQNDINTN